MNAAILCPGPSLPKTWNDDSDGLIVAVNRAALAHLSDVWACQDYPLQQEIASDVRGSPLLLIAAEGLSHINTKGSPWRGPTATLESLFAYFHPAESGTSWSLLTSSSAIVYAASRGATDIRIYGADLVGTADYDGVEGTGNRQPARWEMESRIIERLTEVLSVRGVKVQRIKPEMAA